ncbi:hypothetical protein RJ640_025280 [Escallonia rubra]|uniref:Auxilin-related protein 2 n=1 Tax=Escallonia rubra TaxID=112253 RepID=A0AA88QUZ6_9ASTE|nr:hypothetical protein RJ640_025280 [Escallonia rubra]
MDDFGTFARDFGYRPQGKSAPMRSGLESDSGDRRNRSSSPLFDDHSFGDVYGGPPKYSKPQSMSDFDYDTIFKASEPRSKTASSPAAPSAPVYDKPVYDEDIFDGLPGLRSKPVSAPLERYSDNVFASMPKQAGDGFDDLLGNLGQTEKVEAKKEKVSRGLDDLLPGFGSGSPGASSRSSSESSQPPKRSSSLNQMASNDPFVVLESTSTPVASPAAFTDPLEEISKFGKSGKTSGGVFDDIDPLNGFGKSVPAFSSERSNRGKDESPSRSTSSMSRQQNSTSRDSSGKSPLKYSENHSQKKVPVDDSPESHQPLFDMPTFSASSQRPYSQNASSPPYGNVNFNETSSQADMSPRSEEYVQSSDDVWLTVSEIPLFTQPTSAPPPSRPPPIPGRTLKSERGSFASHSRKMVNDFSSPPNTGQYSESPKPFRATPKTHVVSPIDELEDFAMGRAGDDVDGSVNSHSGEELHANSSAAASAAAMKEAMDRAEAKFRHAKEVRERENAKARSKDFVQLGKDEEAVNEPHEDEFRENQERLDRERRQREEEGREQRRLEKERERAKEIEREKARQAVERATREARERAAAEAHQRAAAEARLKSERAAVQRAHAEARERAAADARGRAERAAAEAKERANLEAREKEAQEKAAVARAEAEARRRAERAAVERASAEARDRAAADARDRAAAAARMNQQKNDNDLESFFSMGSRPSSAPRPRASSSEHASDSLFQSRGGPDVPRRTPSSGVSSNMRKATSTSNIVDDLTSIFGGAPSSGDFQDVEGETEDRRRARLERHHRTQERAAKALAEKNQRDLQTQRDQEERHRIAETLDIEIKRWSAGKEGNLRALLSTLQYVLWPECGWQPVSLTDLITGPAVKKCYRKATLCIHPDKVQQKGANLQQKYVAEKVFDLLKDVLRNGFLID